MKKHTELNIDLPPDLVDALASLHKDYALMITGDPNLHRDTKQKMLDEMEAIYEILIKRAK